MSHPYLEKACWAPIEFHTDCEVHGEHVEDIGPHIVFIYHDGSASYLDERRIITPTPDETWPTRMLN